MYTIKSFVKMNRVVTLYAKYSQQVTLPHFKVGDVSQIKVINQRSVDMHIRLPPDNR